MSGIVTGKRMVKVLLRKSLFLNYKVKSGSSRKANDNSRVIFFIKE
jgi:hypothetical protein